LKKLREKKKDFRPSEAWEGKKGSVEPASKAGDGDKKGGERRALCLPGEGTRKGGLFARGRKASLPPYPKRRIPERVCTSTF